MIPAHVKQLLVDVYGSRWGEAYIEWWRFDDIPGTRGFGRAATASPPADMAVFWSAGLLKPGTGRADENVECVKVFVIDDVGKAPKSKVDPDLLDVTMPPPTRRIGSSPGNYQWQWGIHDDLFSVPLYWALRRSIPVKSDATSPSNMIRLPMGVSGKPGVVHRVEAEGDAGPTYGTDEFIQRCGGLHVAVAGTTTRPEQLAPTLGAVDAALALLPNDGVGAWCASNQAWFDLGQALHGATGGGEEGRERWVNYCATQEQSKADPEATWDRMQPHTLGWKTLTRLLHERVQRGEITEAQKTGALASGLFNDGVDVEAEARARSDTGDTVAPVTLAKSVPEATAGIRRRPWLYGRRLLRGYLSSTIAAGGTGKSSLTTVEAVAMATGRDLLGVGLDNMPRAPLKVLLWNGEDPAHELQLRFNAVCAHYGLVGADFAGGMFMVSGRDRPLRLGSEKHHKKDLAWLRGAIAGNGIDVVVIDPFVASHAVPENDNVAIAGIAKTWSDLADEMGCAVDLVHHIRKPSNGAGVDLTVDDARGASALVNASRNARVLSPMGDKVAKDTGTLNRKAFFAIQHDATKANMVPGMVGASWFKFVSVDMGNGDPFPADGGRVIPADSVGVVEACTLSPSIAAVPANIVAAQQAMAGRDWRAHPTAKDWVGIPVGGALGLDPTDKTDRRVIESAVQTWLKDGWLVAVEKPDQYRIMKGFIEVGRAPEDIDF